MLFYKKSNFSFLNYFLIGLLFHISSIRTLSAEKQLENNHFELNVPFISQKDQDYLPNTSCGPACVMMMLLYQVQQNKLSRTALPDYKKLCLDLKTSIVEGSYIKDIYEYFEQNGWNYRISFKDYHKLANALKEGPIIVFVEDESAPGPLNILFKILKSIEDALFHNKMNHAIVLIGANEQGFIYLDPIFRKCSGNYKQSITYEKFSQQWEGNACQLLA